jgi:Uncharacterized conserved protein
MSNHLLVYQTDFGLQDGAVSAMYGVALSVSKDLQIYNLTHEIPQYDIWEASYRLVQTLQYWEKGTVFVSVVDPGVGSNRKSIVAKTNSGHYVITPDNGTITHIKENVGIVEVREIDEEYNRLPNSGESYTFHGRDVYAYTGARLASGKITFEEVGSLVSIEELEFLRTMKVIEEEQSVTGMIDILDIRFGNLWTNIGKEYFEHLKVEHNERLRVTIMNENREVYGNEMIYVHSFADVNIGETLIYVNSLNNIGIAINQGSFARAYQIGTGEKWKIKIQKR